MHYAEICARLWFCTHTTRGVAGCNFKTQVVQNLKTQNPEKEVLVTKTQTLKEDVGCRTQALKRDDAGKSQNPKGDVGGTTVSPKRCWFTQHPKGDVGEQFPNAIQGEAGCHSAKPETLNGSS